MFDFNDEVTYFVAVVLVIAGFFLVLYYGLNGYLDSVGRKWRREHNLPDWNDVGIMIDMTTTRPARMPIGSYRHLKATNENARQSAHKIQTPPDDD